MCQTVLDRLRREQDTAYAAFQRKLLPTVDPAKIIGVRTPALRQLAAQLYGSEEADAFLQSLPHTYFEENQLHAFLLARMRDFDACLAETERFLPYIDNWATCDQLSPAVFAKHKPALLCAISRWMASGKPYTVRFAIGMLMQHYLDDAFEPRFPEAVSRIRSDDYYVRMMVAWYFATALAKQYDAVLPYLLERRLDPWTHNKTIQKATESRRITPEQKAFLKTCRIR